MREAAPKLALALLLLAALRLAWLFAAEPMLAVANNYDMIRVQACIDAYPDRDATIPPETNSWEGPLERYRFVPGVGAPCFLTSEALFAFLAYPGMWAEQALRADASFSVRWDGAVKLGLLLGLMWTTHRALRRRGREVLVLGHAVVAALVVADPGVGLYLNGFYAEFAGLFFFYALLAALLVGLSGSQVPAVVALAIAGAAVGLALAKAQHLVTPLFVLGVVLGLRLLGRAVATRVLLALALGTLLGTALQGLHLRSDQTRSMGRANVINTVFYAVLPTADEPRRLATQLGLPAECAVHAGKSWFAPGMAEGELCPQALKLSRRQVLLTLAGQPGLVARVLLGGVERNRPWIPANLGLVEGQRLGRLPASQPTLDRLYAVLPQGVYLGLLVAVPFIALVRILRRRDPSQQAANAVLAVLAAYPWFSLAVVVFGDGYADTSKQSHLGHAAFLAALLLLSLELLRWLVQSWRARPQGPG